MKRLIIVLGLVLGALVLKIPSSVSIFIGIASLIFNTVALILIHQGLGLQAITYAYPLLLIGAAIYVYEFKTDKK